MAKKKVSGDGTGFTIEADDYERMVEAMKELAARNSVNEAIVMRIAKAGGIKEVVKHLDWLRKYIKKHAKPQRAAAEDDGEATPRRKRTSRRKRTPNTGSHSHDEGDQTSLEQMA